MNTAGRIHRTTLQITMAAVLGTFGPACAGVRQPFEHSGETTGETSRAASTPDELFRAGMVAAQRQDLTRAQQYLAAAVAAGYPEAQAIVPQIEVCLAGTQVQAAIQLAQAYLVRHPDEWRMRYLLATLYSADHQFEQAVSELRQLVTRTPLQAQAHYLLGSLLRDHSPELHDKPAALGDPRPHFRRYLELEPSGVHAAEARASLAWYAPPIAEEDQAAAPQRAETSRRHLHSRRIQP